MRRPLLIVITFFCIPFFTPPIQACQCDEYGTPVCAVYWRADAVFVGQVAEIKPLGTKVVGDLSYVAVHFNLDQPFRGVSGSQAVVATMSGTMCDVKFEMGKRYLVYASFDDEGKQLFTGFCSHTKPLKQAEEDLAYIRSVMQQGAGQSLSGKVIRDWYQDLSGLKVRIEGKDKIFETTTDEHGNFSVSLPDPGSFKVRVFAPFAADVLPSRNNAKLTATATDTLTTVEYEVKLDKNQCDYQQLNIFRINLHATAVVSGHVLTASGQAVGKGSIDLIDAKDFRSSSSNSLTPEGTFEFKEVAAGEYYLVINPRNEAPGNDDAPYPRTYFPSASDLSDATRIVVTEGVKLEDLTLRVGAPLKQRRVSGTVQWNNNRVLLNPFVSVYDGERYLKRVKVDKKGNFDFVVYGDFDYAVEGGDDRDDGWGRSERVKLTSTNSTGIKLLLRRR